MTVLIISDLHLEEERPDIIRAFQHFLKHEARNAEALYILGDFFESWVGDDEQRPLQQEIAEHLSALAQQGTRIYFMHGNRDFLVGQAYADAARMQLLPDPTVVELGGTPTLLMHGDSLCTKDLEYMKFRAFMRNARTQAMLLARPLAERQNTARQLREMSKQKNQGKKEEIMDVTPEEVVKVMRDHGVQRLIHGHTHRPAVHELEIDGLPSRRYVLGDWDQSLWFIRIDAGQEPELVQQPLAVEAA